MAVAFVRNHTGANNKTAGTTIDIGISVGVASGNTLVARIIFDNFTTASKPIVSSIAKPAGETATWALLGAARSASTSGGAFASGEMWVIRTTVNWPVATYNVTLDSSVTQKATIVAEFSGVQATVVGNAGTNYSTTTTAASAATTGTTPSVGDLAVGLIFGSNVAAAMAGDTDTTGGSWSAAVGFGTTGASSATNNFGIAQYKILTGANAQTLNNSAAMTAGNGAVVAILQQYAPTITQAAYRIYADGTETGSTALAAQNASYTADISTGNVNLQVRALLQSTAQNVFATDDFSLEWEKNASGSWATVFASTVVPYASANLTEGQATTNRLTGGTGTFVAGKVSEDGFVDDLGWTTPNFTEVMYSVTLKKADLANGDTLRFRIVRNGSATGFTYTQTPTINASITPPAITQAAYRFYADGMEHGGTLLDGNPDPNGTFATPMTAATPKGQSFMGNGNTLLSAGFFMAQSGASGTITAALYGHTGTFGTTGGLPTGSALATSTTTINMTSLDATYRWYDFVFDGTYTLANGTPYYIVISTTNAVSDALYVEVDTGTTTHAPGTYASYIDPSWLGVSGDMIFRIYARADVNSGALAAQDAAYSPNLSSGDVNLLLRARLQSTSTTDIAATDDYQLQWEKNSSGTWTSVAVPDSGIAGLYNQTAGTSLDSLTTGWAEKDAQSFIGNGKPLTRALFYLHQQVAGEGTVTAQLYAHTGTFGVNGLPTGTALAVSTAINSIDLPASPAWVTFTFSGTFTLVEGTPYFIAVATTNNILHGVRLTYMYDSAGGAPGNAAVYKDAFWSITGSSMFTSSSDLLFEVGTPVTVADTVIGSNSTSLTNGAATTNRLTGGTGTFQSGKVSKNGLVTDLGWTGNNFIELLYGITLKQVDLSNGDTLRFRVLRNGATTGMTYTQTPTSNITTASPSPPPRNIRMTNAATPQSFIR